ncbi:hypothetical protein AB670_04128 [Chryseobacterium sp. MOF25P]|uniref:hypothetical protein n=1 Tax=unclassified Chryseobacterium TaxID=2593645 RepID=UPI000804A4E7|nr:MULTISPECIES: hypothetical protein [unclassified Chryseobacterium]OBW39518.1 hypothetical protein AB670_04128 [Chryseobacterium sp. MOF25P]OBW44206.1 hypothetical protein AB671_03687 [Chryseobacterium sp. BGARF1]
MKKIFSIFSILSIIIVFSQKQETKIADRYQSSQPQDQSVPAPPRVTFPAQFPDGNKTFLKKIDENIDKEKLQDIGENLNTEIILKIDQQGNVLNISTFGKNENFNKEVKIAATRSTQNIKWTAGKNSQGEKVIDIVRLPYRFKNL